MSAAAQVQVVVAPVFGTNCCVVTATEAVDGARDCVVIDAGAGVVDGVTRIVERQGLRPRAVLATHGHVDHTWDAAELCERYDVPLRLHAADVYRIADPFGTLVGNGAAVSGALAQELAGLGFAPEAYRSPPAVEGFETREGSAVLSFGAVALRAVHAPGHTEGSTLYLLDPAGRDERLPAPAGRPVPAVAAEPSVADDAPDAAPSGLAFTGDVLFAGSIGRTDLPGGDDPTMRVTLRDVVARLDPGLAVVPGHGPTTTVRRELATNPFLG
ncbi:MBL fold metallo-hydrolase [Myceligenerans salitolerans]|uniref:MBL fold metallo-hydrolase n=1 Tax=Myceligenerans salitolerans TaxID=1230528 RepID=A0ABS3ICP7_9MICO|nr:MBL fold metallo-hydrolase [Myceligenerans salitolerans]MBO0610749.1 MBL fold metallo-hydrolase [Myceligenerans salitolerans]